MYLQKLSILSRDERIASVAKEIASAIVMNIIIKETFCYTKVSPWQAHNMIQARKEMMTLTKMDFLLLY